MPKVWDWGFSFCQEKFLICCFFEWGWLISRTFVLVFICKHWFELQILGILFLPRGVFDLMFGFWVVWVILGTFILSIHLQVHCFKLQDLRILFLPRVLDLLLLFLSWDKWFWEHFFLGFICKSIVSNFKILGFYFRQEEFLIRCLEIFNCDVWFWEHLFLICCCRFWLGIRDFGNIICKNCFQLLDLGTTCFPRFLIFFLMCWWGVGVFELGWMKSKQLNIKKSNPICASVSMIGDPKCSHSYYLGFYYICNFFHFKKQMMFLNFLILEFCHVFS